MSTDRLGAVLSAIAADESPSLLSRVCGAARGLVGVSGAGLSLMADGELRGTAGVSEPGIELVQELQLTLGEGPGIDAWRTGGPVLEPDLADPRTLRWPTFAESAVEANIPAVFALPVGIGAIALGVLVLYRDQAGPLDADQLGRGILLADIAAHAILGAQADAPTPDLPSALAEEPPHWAEVHQATGMLSAQLGVSLSEAFVRMRAHAFSQDLPLRSVAGEIVARRLRLASAE